MPKVLIELQANTQAAVQQIQQFAKAQRDAFDAIRAGNPAIAEAQIKISKLTDANRGAIQATQQWQGVLQVLPGNLSAVGSQVLQLTNTLRGPAGLIAGFAAAAAAATGAVSLVTGFSGAIERLDNLSHQTGLSVSALEALQQVARESGESFEAIAPQIGKINSLIADLNKGNVEAVEKNFSALGLSFKALVDSGASTDQILETIAMRINAIPDPTARAAAQADIFGSKSLAMSAILEQVGSQGLQTLITKMQQAGIVTDEATRQMARSIDVMQDLLDRRLQGVKTQLGGGLSILGLELAAGLGRSAEALASALTTGLSPATLDKTLAVFTGFGSEIGQVLDDVRTRTETSFTQLQLRSQAVGAALPPVAQAAAGVGAAWQTAARDADMLTASLSESAAAVDKWASAAAKAAGPGEGFTQLIVEGSTALANMTQAQQDLVVSGGLQTRSFADMGAEVDSLVTEYLHASEALSEYTIATAAQVGSQEEAKGAIVETTQAIEDQAAEAARAAEVVAQAQDAAASAFINAVSVGQSVAEQVDALLKNVGTLDLTAPDVGGEFSFLENPALLAQIEALQHQIVDSSGQARIDAKAQLDALLEANAAQIEADRVAADLEADFKQLDEERNASLTKLVTSSENLEQIAALNLQVQQANLLNAQALTAALATSVPSSFRAGGVIHAQHGFVVPGTGRGDIVPAMLEPGEWIIPRDLTRELMGSMGRSVHGRGQAGGMVGPGAGETVNITVNVGDASKEDADRIADVVAQRLSDQRRRRGRRF